MSLKVKSTPFVSNDKKIFIKKVVSSSALGYIAGTIFSSINPLYSFIFSLTAEVTYHFAKVFFNKINFLKNAKITKRVINSSVAFSAAFFLTNYIGRLTLIQAFKILSFTIITQIAIANIFFITAALGAFAILTAQAAYYFASKPKSLKV